MDFTHYDAVPHDFPLTELHFLSAKKSKDVYKRWIMLAPKKDNERLTGLTNI